MAHGVMIEVQGESSAMDIVSEDVDPLCDNASGHSLVDILGAPFEVLVFNSTY